MKRKRKYGTAMCCCCDSVIPSNALYCSNCRVIKNNIGILASRSNLNKNFTPTDYLALLRKQNNKCAICGTEKCSTGRRFAIDHDHTTGEVRGLLCLDCNVKIGWLEKNSNGIANYL